MPNQHEIDALLDETQQLVAKTAKQLGDDFDLSAITGERPARQKPVDPRIQRVLEIEVPVIVRLGERLTCLSDVLNWTLGSIVEFDKRADAPLDLLINNKPIGCGTAVKVGENFGLHLARVGTRSERIAAMAPSIV